jgi:hypothetical protein
LFAARQAEGVDCQLAADGASELRRDIFLGQGAAISFVSSEPSHQAITPIDVYLMSSACASVRAKDAAILALQSGRRGAAPKKSVGST